MANVVAISKGYYGGMIRLPGDVFGMPDNEVAATSWVRPANGSASPVDAEPQQAEDKPAKRTRKPKAETVEAPQAEPFAHEPEAVTIAEASKELGLMQPDWLPPGSQGEPADDI